MELRCFYKRRPCKMYGLQDEARMKVSFMPIFAFERLDLSYTTRVLVPRQLVCRKFLNLKLNNRRTKASSCVCLDIKFDLVQFPSTFHFVEYINEVSHANVEFWFMLKLMHIWIVLVCTEKCFMCVCHFNSLEYISPWTLCQITYHRVLSPKCYLFTTVPLVGWIFSSHHYIYLWVQCASASLCYFCIHTHILFSFYNPTYRNSSRHSLLTRKEWAHKIHIKIHSARIRELTFL